ncbi:hypothetical protein [Streptomyces sp. NBC_01455]|uniref:hypothetical protein n=1 Tax=Streptomyces sp. NBC_01455 TaxID=2903874 RepID=UPI002E34BDA9|nr:hypothetical protein [Streptomyces sp. NBC_01455]
MSTRRHPPLKSITTTPDGPPAAPQLVDTAAVGDPKCVAVGVPTAVRPDPRRDDTGNPTPDRPGIRIFAPPVYRHPKGGARWGKRYGDTPTAAYACSCGLTDTARGADDVAALIADYDYHRAKECTGGLAALTEGRAAA